MADNTQWFYAQDGKELGPISAKELRELAQRGDLEADQLTWHEGMEDWAPAGEVKLLKGLFPPVPPLVDARPEDVSIASRAAARRAPKLPPISLPADPRRAVRLSGIPVLLLGIVLVVLARGSDNLGNRGVARTIAQSAAAEDQFNDRWDDQKLPLDAKIQALRERDDLDSDEAERLAELQKELTELRDDEAGAREKLERGSWRELKIAARDAERNNMIWSYWRSWLFVLGSILLIIGLIAVGFTGEGPERTICLAMLAIITFSIFVGGWDGGVWTAN